MQAQHMQTPLPPSNTARCLLPIVPPKQAFYSPRPAKQQRDGGCRALQAEFNLTRSSSLMWRRATHELQAALSSGVVPRVYLQGPAGSGKSIAVAQMVEWARSSGWCVGWLGGLRECLWFGCVIRLSAASATVRHSVQCGLW